MPAPSFEVAGHAIGPGEPVYVIAELSANHDQDLSTAKDLVRAAARAGADAVKLQTYTPDTITIHCTSEPFRIESGTLWDGKLLYDLYSEAQTPWDWHPILADLAAELGLHCFSSAFDESSVDFLEEIGTPAYKVASFELVDIPLLRKIGSTHKPVILSTGMAEIEEIDEAVRTVRGAGAAQVALLRTNSGYPASPREINLRAIDYLADRFGTVVGLSDHTLGIAVPIAAVAAGAHIIEKHLTLSRDRPGPDSAFSLEPAEFEDMVEAVRTAEQALGSVRFGPTERELSSLQFRRSLFIVEDIEEGELFTRRNIRSIRPAGGLHTRHLDEVLGRRAARAAARGTPLRWDLIRAEDGRAAGEGSLPVGDVSLPEGKASLRLRRAAEGDRQLLFAWANDETVRRMSFSGAPIAWAEHVRWLDAKLQDPACKLYLLTEADGIPLGQLRLEFGTQREAILSISIAAEHRGRGWGAAAIRLGAEEAGRMPGVAVVHAYVKPENAASIRAFARAGFDPPVRLRHSGQAALRMSLGLDAPGARSAPGMAAPGPGREASR